MINIFSYTIINIDFSKVAKWLSYKQNIEALRGASFIRASSPKDYPSFNSVIFIITPKDRILFVCFILQIVTK